MADCHWEDTLNTQIKTKQMWLEWWTNGSSRRCAFRQNKSEPCVFSNEFYVVYIIVGNHWHQHCSLWFSGQTSTSWSLWVLGQLASSLKTRSYKSRQVQLGIIVLTNLIIRFAYFHDARKTIYPFNTPTFTQGKTNMIASLKTFHMVLAIVNKWSLKQFLKIKAMEQAQCLVLYTYPISFL